MARILLLSVDRALAEAIGEAMAGRVPVELMQALEPDRLDGPAVVVVDSAAIPPERSLAAAVAAVVGSAGGRPVVVAVERADSDEILRAVRAGADDVVPRNADGRELAEVLSRLLNGALVDQGEGGRLTLLLGPDQHAAAIVATDLALLRCRERPSVLLVDCTLPTSTCEAYLDIKAGYGLATAIAELERLDASLLASTVARHPASGLMLLTFDGGTGAEPVGIAPGDIASLVRLLRACCSDVILCAGSLRHPALLRELGTLADRVELVCPQSIRELEDARRLLDRIAFEPSVRKGIRLLVWNHLPGVLLGGQRMAQVLEIGASLDIPADPVRLSNALNSGQPLALAPAGGAYLQALRRVADCRGRARQAPLRAPQGWALQRIDKLRGAVLGMVEARR